ncbi:MAG: radical SAM protein [Chloroflexi bacterium]|nr:radical SAM protein [Chloroflexota bacterium]
MLRILLVNPKSNLPIDTRTSPAMGLAYLGAVSLARGDEVHLWDGDVEDQSLAHEVETYRPHLVGITANTTQIRAAWAAADEVKGVADVPVVLGGPHPTILPEESAARPAVDLVARGEGERTWTELSALLEQSGIAQQPLGALLGQQPDLLAGVLGITYRMPDGQVRANPDRPTIADLDSLPWPAWRLYKLDRYTNLQPTLDAVQGRSLPILTSRGCPYRCAYCSQITERRWRMRSAESVAAEWRWLVQEMGAGEIGVLDDSFNINRQRVLDLCALLVEQGLHHVPWIMINGIRANLANEELLGQMRRAGCIRTAFGVESGNQEILDRIIHKQLTLEQIRSAFRAAKSVGMETIGFFILGMPGETEETMEQTIRFAIELDPLVANFSMATPFPGTELYQIVQREGRILANDWDDFVFFEGKARFEMPGLPAELVERKWKEAYRRFYLRPRRVLRTLARKKTWLDLPRTLRVAWRTAVTGGE